MHVVHLKGDTIRNLFAASLLKEIECPASAHSLPNYWCVYHVTSAWEDLQFDSNIHYDLINVCVETNVKHEIEMI